MELQPVEDDILLDDVDEGLRRRALEVDLDLLGASPRSFSELDALPSTLSATVTGVHVSDVSSPSTSTALNFVDESGSDLAGYVPAPRIEQPLPHSRRKNATLPEPSTSGNKLPKITIINRLIKRPFGPRGLDQSKCDFSVTNREDRAYSPGICSLEVQEQEATMNESEKGTVEEEQVVERTHMDPFYDMCGLTDMPLVERRSSAVDLHLRVAMVDKPQVLMERVHLSTVKYFEDLRQERLQKKKHVLADLELSLENDEELEEVFPIDNNSGIVGSGKKVVPKGRVECSVTSASTSLASSTSSWTSPCGSKKAADRSEDAGGKVKFRFGPLLLSCVDARKGHKKMHGQRDKKFRCAHCCLSADAKYVVSKHEKIHIGEQPMDRTNEPISEADGYESSDEEVELVEKKQCRYCPQRVTPANLAWHEKQHSRQDATFHCEYCTFAHNAWLVVVQHQKVHPADAEKLPTEAKESADQSDSEDEADRPLSGTKCAHCPQMCTKGNLTKHEKMHTLGGAEYQCEHCSYSSNHVSSLRRHEVVHGLHQVKTASSNIKSTPKQSQRCRLVESDNGRESGEEGQSEGEEDEGTKEQCHYCPQVVSQSNIGRHEKLHFLQDAQFRCEQCNFGSSSRHAVTGHMKVHRISVKEQKGTPDEADDGPSCRRVKSPPKKTQKGERSDLEDQEEGTSGRTKCSYCPQLCTIPNLKRHENLHFFDEAKYECDYCSYSSDCRKSVVKHEKLHGARQTKATTNCTKSTPKNTQKKSEAMLDNALSFLIPRNAPSTSKWVEDQDVIVISSDEDVLD
ncbi:hypothetical protein RvY_13413-2 [Ramazzottius varieornatus]|uniref:C2H2-type domain-containing protein n=1 Tax=Ramazzottius varieornatus TaxID=947166 RepID=A0A1D1VMR9_RAMVA|nr:hypothetical protein RvY_13413-2 [Ramazzottius varieornatus]